MKVYSLKMLTAGVVLLTAASGSSEAQGVTELCLKSGATIHASRIELRGREYVITPRGQGAAALRIPADQVKAIGATCEDASPPSGQDPGQTVQPLPPSPPVTASPPVTTQALQIDPSSPRFGVQGSDIIGARLMPLLIDAYAKKRGWNAAAKPTDADGQEIELSAPGATQPSAIIDLKITNSAEGIAALTEGAAAIALASRRASFEEAAQVRARYGVDPLLPSSGAEHVVALDAVAAIVHRDNPIKRLRLDQMAQIFSGQITNWRDARGWNDDEEETSGPDAPIRVHGLDVKSDSYGFFKTAVLDPFNTSLTPAAEQHDTGKKLSKAVGRDIHAIGFVEFPNISKNDALSIGTGCSLSSEASRYSVKTEQYPLARRLYLYTAGEPRQRVVRDFVQFALSDEAQAVVRDAGFIDQSIEYEALPEQRKWFTALIANPLNGLIDQRLDAASQEARMKKLTSKMGLDAWRQFSKLFIGFVKDLRRTSIVFRFETNSSELDARALQDVERLSRYLQSKSAEKAYFRLLGFADSVGNFSHNFALTKQRSKQVLDQMKRRGVVPAKESGAVGFGSFAPVACNDTEDDLARNRRVEAWMPDPGSK